MKKRKNRIVIGGSSGAFDVLLKILSALDPQIEAAIFVTLHLAYDREGDDLIRILNAKSSLPVKFGTDGEEYMNGKVYIAPPNLHLIVVGNHIKLSSGPRENRSRPAIDPLFRSAAVEFGAQAIGVILSGFLDDGSAGLAAIKQCGGTTIVQQPSSAKHADMPQNAIESLSEIDFILLPDEIPVLFKELVETFVDFQPAIPDSLKSEISIISTGQSSFELQNRLGEVAPFICPDCDGPLWQVNDDQIVRYRCHTGHGITLRSLAESYDRDIEYTLWAAVRQFEEHARVLSKLIELSSEKGNNYARRSLKQKYDETLKHSKELRKFLSDLFRLSKSY